MPVPADRRTISETVRIARIAVVLLALGVALSVFGKPSWLRAPEPREPTGDPPPQGSGEDGDGEAETREAPPIDIASLAESFGRFANAPRPAEPEQDESEQAADSDASGDAIEPGGEGDGSQDGDGQPERELAFVGAVISPGRRVAVLRLDGEQRWVAEGERHAGVRVVEVTETSCVYEDDTGERQLLDRAERTGSPVAVLNQDRDDGAAGARQDDGSGDTAGSAAEARRRYRERLREQRQRQVEQRRQNENGNGNGDGNGDDR